jgi:acyl-homoserine-lactone acylase
MSQCNDEPVGQQLWQRSRIWKLGAALALALAVGGCDDDEGETPNEQPPPVAPTPKYQATVRRTSHGIPHITAESWGGAGFGQGYAFAEDHACILADQVLKVRGERARYLGPGPGDALIASDFVHLALDLRTRATEALAAQPTDVREFIEGYTAGYNRYLADVGGSFGVKGWCQGQPWVRRIDTTDLMAHLLGLSLAASSTQFILNIAAATPPAAPAATGAAPGPTFKPVPLAREGALASNGWAIGSERSASGRGMVVGNPHFPWEGELRLWESHLTIPGQLDVYGVSLMGTPGVLIGFNENVAWTHTFSSGQRFSMYVLPLVPGSPTTYVYDGAPEPMTTKEIEISVLQGGGAQQVVKRTFYSSRYGPIISPAGGVWNSGFALSYRDANLDNKVLIRQFLGMNRARSLDEFKQTFAEVQGIPWVNTMATDRDGNLWYSDASATPNHSPAALERWRRIVQNDSPPASPLNPVIRGLALGSGVIAFDGSDPTNEWVEEEGARDPGLVPFARVPQLERTDYVFNANDSYWLANPAEPLTGFSPLQGLAGVQQSLRTRMNLVLLEEGARGASGEDGKFTLEELQAAIIGNRSMSEELLRDDVVARCQAAGASVAAACTVLEAWDGLFNVDSKGAALWREFTAALAAAQEAGDADSYFSQPFDPADPIGTPHTLEPAPASGTDPVVPALETAVSRLQAAGKAPDVALGEVQFHPRAGTPIPVHGGIGSDGVANVVTYRNSKSSVDPSTPRGTVLNAATGLSSTGYVINYGTSFLMAMEFTDEGPRAQAFLTYGESEDPASAFYSDQLQRFSRKEWRDIRFSAADIAADPALTEKTVAGN